MEELETYFDYKNNLFNNTERLLESALDNIASSSLKDEDKKRLVLKLYQIIQHDLFIKL